MRLVLFLVMAGILLSGCATLRKPDSVGIMVWQDVAGHSPHQGEITGIIYNMNWQLKDE
jgi:uncharacterized protein YceK